MNKRNKQFWLKDTAIVFVLKVFFTFCSFVSSVLLSRYFGGERIGVYFSFVSALTIASVLCRCGIDNVITRFIASKVSIKKSAILMWAFSKLHITSYISVSISVAIFGMSYFSSSHKGIHLAIAFAALFAPLLSYGAVYESAFKGIKNVKLYGFYNGVARFLLLCTAFGVIHFYEYLDIETYIVVHGIVLSFYLLFIYCHWLIIEKNLDMEVGSTDIVMLNRSSPDNWIIAVLSVFMLHSLQVGVGFLSSQQEAGLFGVSMRVASVLVFLLAAFNTVLAPRFAECSMASSNEALKLLYKRTTIICGLISVPIITLIWLFSSEILLLFGAEFIDAKLTLQVLLLGQLFKALVGPTGNLLIMSGNEAVQKKAVFISVIVLVSLGGGLIPVYGALGAALSASAAVIVNNAISFIYVIDKFKNRETT
ncbi:MATE family efflux transporter [Flocculibacter collagenilyticus]|uniref:MATE family efflux transporter n=1 Tax=Flocculibacter collagenilyticus TaxID=2744479 RepID=UPI0018F6AE11|nr:polysaccharide biosynthesis C-terminal domain-containing protein [Flocculibacter collagenilyticus]